MIIEHRWTHYLKGHVPEGYYADDMTQPKKLRCGQHVTIVSTAYATVEANAACDALATEGIMGEHFDLRVLRPLNLDDIFASVRHTGRLLVIDTGYKTLGIGAEIAAQAAERFPGIAISRIGLPDHPVPSSRGYIPGIYPDAQMIADAVCHMLRRGAPTLPKSDTPIDIPDPSYQGSF